MLAGDRMDAFRLALADLLADHGDDCPTCQAARALLDEENAPEYSMRWTVNPNSVALPLVQTLAPPAMVQERLL